MKIGVGSKNKTKVNAVAEVVAQYPLFEGAEVVGVAVEIEEFGHPKSIDETVAGAVHRAKQAYSGNDYGFGIESGLMVVPQTKSGYMEVAACAIYDGKEIHLGLSQAYEWPKNVLKKILEGMDGSQAMKAAGLTAHEKLGEHEGFVGVFTNRHHTLESHTLPPKIAPHLPFPRKNIHRDRVTPRIFTRSKASCGINFVKSFCVIS